MSKESKEVEAAEQDLNKEEKLPSRRAIFGSVAALSVLALQACSESILTGTSDKNNSREQDGDPATAKPADTKKKTSKKVKPTTVIKVAEECHASRINRLPNEYEKTPKNLQPKVVFYGNKTTGNPTTSMMAYHFSNDAVVKVGNKNETVESVTLLAADKRIIAYQPLSEADLCQFIPGQTYNPMIVDNLYFKETATKICMLIKIAGKIYSHEVPIVYFTEFQGKQVFDYSDPSSVSLFVNGSGINTLQSIARFNEVSGKFWKNDKIQFPNDFETKADRPLMTATQEARWTRETARGLIGIVTDIMGNVVTVEQDFLIKYQTFCAYVQKDGEDGVLYRSMMKVG